VVEFDNCTHKCLALVADTSISGICVARELDRLLAERGKPRMIVGDNGTSSFRAPSCDGRTITR